MYHLHGFLPKQYRRSRYPKLRKGSQSNFVALLAMRDTSKETAQACESLCIKLVMPNSNNRFVTPGLQKWEMVKPITPDHVPKTRMRRTQKARDRYRRLEEDSIDLISEGFRQQLLESTQRDIDFGGARKDNLFETRRNLANKSGVQLYHQHLVAWSLASGGRQGVLDIFAPPYIWFGLPYTTCQKLVGFNGSFGTGL
jgi:hypothetical protein